MQGFYFSEPVAAESFAQLLAGSTRWRPEAERYGEQVSTSGGAICAGRIKIKTAQQQSPVRLLALGRLLSLLAEEPFPLFFKVL